MRIRIVEIQGGTEVLDKLRGLVGIADNRPESQETEKRIAAIEKELASLRQEAKNSDKRFTAIEDELMRLRFDFAGMERKVEDLEP